MWSAKNPNCNPFLQSRSVGKGDRREEKESVVLANPKVTTKMQVSAPN